MKSIPYKYAVSLTAALGLFMAVLDNTIVNVSLTAMQKAFDTNINSIQWVITGYFLAQAAVIPAAGYFSNRLGLKRMFMFALVIFTVGSFLCGISPIFAGTGGDGWLIAFRVLQGIGGGMLFPLATSISFGAFPPAERAASSAVVAIPVLLAPTLGPTVGGFIVDTLGWEWIFFINIPVGILALFLIYRIMKPDNSEAPAGAPGGRPAVAATQGQPGKRPGFDYIGLLLSMLGVVLLVYAFTIVSETDPATISATNPRGSIYGWGYWQVWSFMGAGLLLLLIFGYYATRISKDPVVDLNLFRTGNFAIASVITWLVRAVIFGSFFLIPLFLEQLKGQSAVNTGLAMMPQGIGAMIGILTGSRLYDRIGPRFLVILGLLALTVSSIMLIGINKDSDGWFFLPILIIRGIGFGWSNLPLQTVALSSISGRALAKASSLYNAAAQIFSSIGISVLSTFFIQNTTSHATDIANATRAAGQRPPADIALQAGAAGMSDTFLAVTIGTVVAIFVALLLPRRSLKQEQQGAAGGAATEGRPATMME